MPVSFCQNHVTFKEAWRPNEVFREKHFLPELFLSPILKKKHFQTKALTFSALSKMLIKKHEQKALSLEGKRHLQIIIFSFQNPRFKIGKKD